VYIEDWPACSCVSHGRTIFVADAHRGDGQRFIVGAEEKLTAFLDWILRMALAANCFDKQARFFKTRRR
jgi:hypothetical protein